MTRQEIKFFVSRIFWYVLVVFIFCLAFCRPKPEKDISNKTEVHPLEVSNQ